MIHAVGSDDMAHVTDSSKIVRLQVGGSIQLSCGDEEDGAQVSAVELPSNVEVVFGPVVEREANVHAVEAGRVGAQGNRRSRPVNLSEQDLGTPTT